MARPGMGLRAKDKPPRMALLGDATVETIDFVRAYIAAGSVPIPLRCPGESFRTKTGIETADGKRPAIRWRELADYDDQPAEVGALLEHWQRRPDWGVGVLLRPSRLLVVDCDSPEAVAEAIANTGEPCHNIVLTRHGAHLYYRRPAGCPPLRTVQRGASGKIDILADGFMVAPPSVHQSGFVYRWHSTGPLQEAPEWAAGLLMAIRERSFVSAGVDPSREQPLRLTAAQTERLKARDRRVYHYMLGKMPIEDRSRGIWLAVNTLIRLREYDDAQIANLIWYSALGEKPRQRGIEWLGDEIARARLELTPD